MNKLLIVSWHSLSMVMNPSLISDNVGESRNPSNVDDISL